MEDGYSDGDPPSFKTRLKMRIDEGQDDSEEEAVRELVEQDKKSFETIKKIIQAGKVDRLTMDECKVYLRNHGLRLSGAKATLIMRIKEHLDIINGGGKKRYPASSFVLNCRGDACVGDIVMFKQNVYEEFSVVSRSANGTCGTRTVAGRIVKESYGAAKQQHTFTIEVLWSKGEKPLPPLYPMLIKGRNLYRLTTMRQKWDDEEERLKVLSEKHARGDIARLNREARIKQREGRIIHKPTKATKDENSSRKNEGRRDSRHSVIMKPQNHHYAIACDVNIPIQLRNLQGKVDMPAQRLPLSNINYNFQQEHQACDYLDTSRSPLQGGFHVEQIAGSRLHRSQSHNHQGGPYHNWSYSMRSGHNHPGNLLQSDEPFQQQHCRYYNQGRCFYGDNCKYLH